MSSFILPKAVQARLASREHRLHHFLWHETRNRWEFPADRGGFTDEVKDKIRELGWEPPRPARAADGRPILDNLSGEDFLFMHRQMIARVNAHLEEVGDPDYPAVVGWVSIPLPDDPDFQVPPAWYITTIDDAVVRERIFRRIQQVKSDEFFFKTFRFWERQFTDPNYLQGMSLGELGARLEFTIHNQLHNRFSEKPYGDRPTPSPEPEGLIPEGWDDPRYDYLGDTYSSHVNSVFWKLHGWVDDRIEDWRYANGVFGPIDWQGTWEGVVPENDSSTPEPATEEAAPEETAPEEAASKGSTHDHASADNQVRLASPQPAPAPLDAHSHHDMKKMEQVAIAIGSCPGRYSFLEDGWVID